MVYQTARQAAEAASVALFSDEPLPNIGSEIWRNLWESARRYSDQEAYPEYSFPVVEPAAVCVLCQQDLSPDAARRLSRFEAFIKDDSKRGETDAKNAYDAALSAFRNARIGEDELASLAACVADELLDAPLAEVLREVTQGCLARHQNVESRHAFPEAPIYAESPQIPFDQLRTHIVNFNNRASGLTAEADSEQRKALIAKQQELADRQWLGTVLGDVLAHIERLKQVARLEAIKRDTATNRITSKSTEIAKTLVTDALRAQFAIEADRLGVASLAIELRQDQSSQGIPRFKVALTRKPTANVGDVLSEGEHRCVALAAFLAELATTDSKSAIVFDDPISSLDHMHREKVAERLIAESRERQVIVFTHDIAFLFLLDQACQECEPRPHCTFRSISRGRDYSGFCNTEPPFKARPLNDVVTSMENRLNSEKIHYERGNQVQWEQTVRSLQEQLRTAWERAVEESVSPVLKRLSNKIDTTGLARLTALTLKDCEVMRAAFRRCSALLHSQAVGLNMPLPEPATIQAEITALRDWISSVKQHQTAIQPI